MIANHTTGLTMPFLNQVITLIARNAALVRIHISALKEISGKIRISEGLAPKTGDVKPFLLDPAGADIATKLAEPCQTCTYEFPFRNSGFDFFGGFKQVIDSFIKD